MQIVRQRQRPARPIWLLCACVLVASAAVATALPALAAEDERFTAVSAPDVTASTFTEYQKDPSFFGRMFGRRKAVSGLDIEMPAKEGNTTVVVDVPASEEEIDLSVEVPTDAAAVAVAVPESVAVDVDIPKDAEVVVATDAPFSSSDRSAERAVDMQPVSEGKVADKEYAAAPLDGALLLRGEPMLHHADNALPPAIKSVEVSLDEYDQTNRARDHSAALHGSPDIEIEVVTDARKPPKHAYVTDAAEEELETITPAQARTDRTSRQDQKMEVDDTAASAPRQAVHRERAPKPFRAGTRNDRPYIPDWVWVILAAIGGTALLISAALYFRRRQAPEPRVFVGKVDVPVPVLTTPMTVV